MTASAAAADAKKGEACAPPFMFEQPPFRGRAQGPVAAAEAEAAVPGTYPSPGSPSRPGTSASPVAAEEVAAAEAAEAAAGPTRSCSGR